MEIGRREPNSVVQHFDQIIRNDALDAVAVSKLAADPQSFELGAAQEHFALRLRVVRKLADKMDALYLRDVQILILAVAGQELHSGSLAKSTRVEIALNVVPS